MKIHFLTQTPTDLDAHREGKPESFQDPSSEQYPHDSVPAGSALQDFSEELDQQLLSEAIGGFDLEQGTLGSGLRAILAGVGPGLKVVLKDAQGMIVRQLTGTEFLKLRENARSGPRLKGKILDHKL